MILWSIAVAHALNDEASAAAAAAAAKIVTDPVPRVAAAVTVTSKSKDSPIGNLSFVLIDRPW